MNIDNFLKKSISKDEHELLISSSNMIVEVSGGVVSSGTPSAKRTEYTSGGSRQLWYFSNSSISHFLC
jgi:hypothetical protein